MRNFLGGLIFATFIALKVGLAVSWSWWWILMPLVPIIGYFVLGVS